MLASKCTGGGMQRMSSFVYSILNCGDLLLNGGQKNWGLPHHIMYVVMINHTRMHTHTCSVCVITYVCACCLYTHAKPLGSSFFFFDRPLATTELYSV